MNISQISKFAIIGLLNTAIDFVVFMAAIYGIGTSSLTSNILSWSVAVTCSYVLNTLYTFQEQSESKLKWKQYLRFIASGGAGLVINTSVLLGLEMVAPLWVAKLGATGAGFIVNYVLTKTLVYPQNPATRN